VLVNAARRVPDGPVGLALELLCVHETPSALMADERVQVLEEARDSWRDEYARAIRTAPRVAEEVALIRFSSPCQIHPLIATAWARRLKPRAVIAANDGYLVGRVNFSIRGGRGDLRKLLLNALSDVGGEFGHGHPRATGGSISPGDFDRLQHSFGHET
jgi:single-stranded-DNA-specific exonuclease